MHTKSNNITVNHPLPNKVSHKDFFDSLTYFHNKVRDLKDTLINYSLEKGIKCDKEFFAVLLENNIVIDVSESIYHDIPNFEKFKEAIELWSVNRNLNISLYGNIYKLDIDDKIILFASFQNLPENLACTDDEKVIAGYILPNTLDNRLLIFSLSNKGITNIKERTEQFLREAIV